MRQLKISKSITNRDASSLDIYLSDIKKEELINIIDEVELTQKIKQGDQAALDKLIKANLRFVVSVAKQYQNQGISLPDLINEGNLGLIKAAQRFDETKGFKFISYAVRWIRQSILQALSNHANFIRLPLNQVGSLNKIKKYSNTFQNHNQRPPTIEELAENLELSTHVIRDLINGPQRPTSLDAPLDNENDHEGNLLNILESTEFEFPDAQLHKEGLQQEIGDILSNIDPRAAKILIAFYGLDGKSPLSLQEIGEEFGLTRERVRQIKEKWQKKLKYHPKIKQLKQYL